MTRTEATATVHVLHLTDNLKVGGVQKVIVNLNQMLSPTAVRTSVAASPEGELWNLLPPAVAKYYAPPRTGILNKFRYIKWLRQSILRSGCDLVHAHQRGVALSAKVAVIGTKVPVVEHVHSIFDSHKLLSFRGDLLVACGSAITDVLTGTYKKHPSKVRTILNSVPDLAPNGISPIPSINGALPKIICIGRLTSVKDPLRFVRLVAELNSGSHPVVDAVWLGDGELRDDAIDLANRLGCKGLSFVGKQTDVASYIRNSDLLVMTSQREGLPLAILEAMSLGRGVIAPNIGSCSDAILQGKNGVLYDPAIDIDSLASLVRQSLDPKNLESWASCSRQIYLKSFHPSASVPLLIGAYMKAVSMKVPPRGRRTARDQLLP
jgi:glycosyltransferase involved in cell wall biosynthesis